MQFVVPQFIDVEDRIIGPITTRQFIMGIVAGLFVFLAYRFSDLALFIIEVIIIFGFYILMAFVKVNGRPFYFFILNIVETIKRPRLRVWYKKGIEYKITTKKEEEKEEDIMVAPIRKRLIDQELSALALLVDTGGRYRPEEIIGKAGERGAQEKKEE